mgnify:CR=1 FL=1
MYPYLLGDSYVVMLILGVIAAIVVAVLYMKFRIKLGSVEIIDICLCTIVAVIAGVIFAILFENFYEWIQKGKVVWTWGMTFIGGLFGGVVGFLLMYYLFYVKRHQAITGYILIGAPACITIAHAIGRIGCFLEGCCYGKETDSWIGIVFPYGMGAGVKRIPTQLIESIFLFILSDIFIYLIFKTKFKYTLPVYLMVYGVFRFIIEFYRDDNRGQLENFLSPSQIWCIVMFMAGIALIFLQKLVIFKGKQFYEGKN